MKKYVNFIGMFFGILILSLGISISDYLNEKFGRGFTLFSIAIGGLIFCFFIFLRDREKELQLKELLEFPNELQDSIKNGIRDLDDCVDETNRTIKRFLEDWEEQEKKFDKKVGKTIKEWEEGIKKYEENIKKIMREIYEVSNTIKKNFQEMRTISEDDNKRFSDLLEKIK